MRLGVKELDALRWIAEQHPRVHGMDVEEWRDRADVGWLIATVHPHPGRGFHRHLPEPLQYRVSPLGHVYERDRIVREGPDLTGGMAVVR